AASLPIGSIADWVGAKRMLVLIFVWRAVCFAALAFVGDVAGLVLVASAQAAAQQSASPITQALVGSVMDDRTRTRTMAQIRSLRNAGFSIGALAAAPLIVSDHLWLNRSLLIGTGAAFLAGGLILCLVTVPETEPEVEARRPFAGLRAVADWRYLAMAGANGVLAMHLTLLTVGLPLYVAADPDVSDGFVSVLLFVNTVTVIFAQVPFSKGVTGASRARSALWRAAASLAGCCAVLAAGGRLDGAVAAIAVVFLACLLLTCGELWQAVGAWELSYVLAPERSRSAYLTVFNLGRSAQESVGPILIGAFVLTAGDIGWLVLGVLFVLGALGATTAAKRIESRKRAHESVSVGAADS
ncbi:MFS transporter, partial [Glycomyces tenuis]